MSKACLSFELPAEIEEFHQAAHASEAFSAFGDIREYIRGKLKYTELSDETREQLEAIREMVPVYGWWEI